MLGNGFGRFALQLTKKQLPMIATEELLNNNSCHKIERNRHPAMLDDDGQLIPALLCVDLDLCWSVYEGGRRVCVCCGNDGYRYGLTEWQHHFHYNSIITGIQDEWEHGLLQDFIFINHFNNKIIKEPQGAHLCRSAATPHPSSRNDINIRVQMTNWWLCVGKWRRVDGRGEYDYLSRDVVLKGVQRRQQKWTGIGREREANWVQRKLL